MTSLNKVFADLPVTIFEAMSQAARDNNAIHLGQGFPDDPGPEDIRRAAADAVMDGYNQYPSMMGLPELRQAISGHYGRWHGLDLDPMTEVMVTSGGTEALTSAILAVVEPGEEVVVFQPVYDSYLPIIRQAGGIPRLVRLEPPHWRLTEEALRSVFNHKTKAVLFNNPLNPAAVVYPREDLELLARFCQEFDTIAICDEVWEHVIFDGREHIPPITIPGMRDRTIKVGSAGKIFALTGWKIGFVCAAPQLLRVAAKVHQFLTFTTAPNLQVAVAYGLGKPADYFYQMRKELARSRDRLTAGLESIGFPVLRSQGTYFLTVDLSPPATAEGRTVNFYNWSNYMAPGVLEDFTRETGIKVVYDTFDANETLETRLLAGNSGYDVVVPTAYFLQRQITANVFQKLDKSKLPNLANAWPVVTKRLAVYDPGNIYGANYMWGTTGIGYNVKAVQKILGADARIDSWDDVFKPDNLAKFKDCGIHMLDSADDIFPAALSYLGLDPNSTRQADLEKAADLVQKIRPNVRKFHSSEYLSALATGEICLVVGWSGDIMQARSRAAEAKNDVEIGYAIPREGAQMFFDNLAIPADAKNVNEAYEMINYLYRPEVAAKNSDFLSYANC